VSNLAQNNNPRRVIVSKAKIVDSETILTDASVAHVMPHHPMPHHRRRGIKVRRLIDDESFFSKVQRPVA
jgi:hypothetical protein